MDQLLARYGFHVNFTREFLIVSLILVLLLQNRRVSSDVLLVLLHVLTEKGRDGLLASEREQLILPDLSEGLERLDRDESLSPREKAARKE